MEPVVETTNAHNKEFKTFKPLGEKAAEKNIPDGHEVYHWPEFKAFAERLGIQWSANTTDLCIFIPLEGSVRITHEYLGDEMFNMRRERESR